jgi:pilus assembly protein Flp/PilA
MTVKNISTSVVRFLKEEDGPTSVEYAVMLFIFLACIVGITLVGIATGGNFNQAADAKW